MSDSGPSIFVALALLAVIVGATSFYACDDNPSPALRALAAQGFTEARIERHEANVLGLSVCGEDVHAFRARVKNPAGNQVSVVVCCGMAFKGCTIRSPR